jgi:ssDNA-binding replication factor A large subunit
LNIKEFQKSGEIIMKKYITSVTNQKGEQKEISVWLDDETSKVLDEANDPEFTQFYIVENIRKI